MFSRGGRKGILGGGQHEHTRDAVEMQTQEEMGDSLLGQSKQSLVSATPQLKAF